MIHKSTPVLTEHARQRCAEMGISTKVAKQILRTACLTRPSPGSMGRGNERMAYSTEHPEYCVIYVEPEAGPPVIVTVLYWSPDREYVRAAAS